MGRVAALRGRIIALCPERQLFLHSNGHLRGLRISPRAQMIGAVLIAMLVIAAGALTLSVALGRSDIARDRAALAAEAKAVNRATAKADAYRRSVDDLARKLEARQDFMDDLYRAHFGKEGAGPADDGLLGKPDDAPREKGGHSLKARISTAPQAAPLLKVDARQRRFAALLTRAVQHRADRTAAAIRSFGLNPDALARAAARAQGGPFVPWRGQDDAMPGEFERLASALSRMEFLESSLLAIPSGRPTAAPMQSSSYGYRRDPFNGAPPSTRASTFLVATASRSSPPPPGKSASSASAAAMAMSWRSTMAMAS